MPSALAPDRPLYLALADRIQSDIERGRLTPGARLPAQRDLAVRLGVDFTTVTRGYTEARRRGLLVGQVGRGTFVRARRREPAAGADGFQHGVAPAGPMVDLTLNLPPSAAVDEATRALAATLDELRRAGSLGGLLEYGSNAGREDHRSAGARWVGRALASDPDPDRIVISAGAQHAITALLMTVARPGDVVLAEALTYPRFLSVAASLGLRVVGLPMDAHGLDPDAFRAACRAKRRPAALFCMPTLQNPTTAVMPVARRRQIAAIADQYGVAIIEDDVYGVLMANAPRPLTSFTPDHGYLIASLSKAVAPGLRTAFVLTPGTRQAERVADAVGATIWNAPLLLVEIASRWIGDGTAERVLAQIQSEMRSRHALAESVLTGATKPRLADGLHRWIALPDGTDVGALTADLRRAGLGVLGSDVFRVAGGAGTAGLRLALGAPPTRDALVRGLNILIARLGRVD